jgi:transcriptional regulator with XRE-family HTH domain
MYVFLAVRTGSKLDRDPWVLGDVKEDLARAESHIATLLKTTSIATVAARIRRARLQQGVSVRDLAVKAVVSKTSIVNLEKGTSCRPITILKVGLALGLHVDRFFQETSATDEAIAVHRSADDRWYALSGYGQGPLGGQDRPLSPEERLQFHAAGIPAQMAIFQSRLPDSAFWTGLIEVSAPSERSTHPGQEFVYVLQGTLLLEVEGKSYRLVLGESAAFRGERPHTYAPEGDAPCLFLCLRVD